MASRMQRWLAGAMGIVALGQPACDDDEAGPCRTFRGGECVGVTPGALCDDAPCTEGVSCSEVIELEDGDDLAGALAGAAPGACIALDEGSYGAASVPAGVSVLGLGADHVEVASITLAGADARVLRGFRTHGPVEVGEGAVVRLESLRIEGGANGVRATNADVTIAASEIRGAETNAIVAEGSALAVERSIVEDNLGPAIWAACAAGCACATPPVVRVERSLLQRNQYVGVALSGVRATLSDVDIVSTAQRSFQYGGGLMAAACTELEAAGVHIEDSADFGALIHDSSGSLGGAGERGIIIIGGRVGLWLQDIGATRPDASLSVENFTAQKVRGVGIGMGGASRGIIIIGGHVSDTESIAMPVYRQVDDMLTTSTEDVGDGLVWSEGVGADIDGLAIDGSARNSVLIHGGVAAGSRLANLVLAGGDEAKGIVQQGVEAGDEAPDVEGSPPVAPQADAPYGVPQPPVVAASP
jgi:hypothetical protein